MKTKISKVSFCLIIKRQPNNYGFKHPWPYFLFSVSNRSILINEHSCCIGYSVVFNDLSCPWKKLRIFGKAKFRWNEVNNPKQKRIKKQSFFIIYKLKK
ncbi:hypothetical protein quinque_005560 [Culex quinquefasciatus]